MRLGWFTAPHAALSRQGMGKPVHDDRRLFEMLLLEGAQAGLSWETVLRRREGYRRAFAGFDPVKVATFGRDKQAALLRDVGIIRNRLKIEAAVSNARAFLAVQNEFGSFDRYVWQFVEGAPIVNGWKRSSDVPATVQRAIDCRRISRSGGFGLSAVRSCTPSCKRWVWSMTIRSIVSSQGNDPGGGPLRQ